MNRAKRIKTANQLIALANQLMDLEAASKETPKKASPKPRQLSQKEQNRKLLRAANSLVRQGEVALAKEILAALELALK